MSHHNLCSYFFLEPIRCLDCLHLFLSEHLFICGAYLIIVLNCSIVDHNSVFSHPLFLLSDCLFWISLKSMLYIFSISAISTVRGEWNHSIHFKISKYLNVFKCFSALELTMMATKGNLTFILRAIYFDVFKWSCRTCFWTSTNTGIDSTSNITTEWMTQLEKKA